MKKGLIFLLAIIYITLTSGIVVNIHYCMGRVAGVTYGAEAGHRCDKCGMEQKKGCCDTDHIYAKSITAPLTFEAQVPKAFLENNLSYTLLKEHNSSRYHSPPDSRSNKLTIYNSVFRI